MRRCNTRSWRPADEMQRGVASRSWLSRSGGPLAIGLLLPLAFGCVTKGTYDEVADERDQLAVARRDLEKQVEKLTAANRSLTAERIALIDANEDLRISTDRNQREVEKLTRTKAELTESLELTAAQLAARSAEIEKMRSSYDGLISDLEDEVASGQIQIEQLRSGLTLNLSEEILFPSGSAALNSSGRAVLTKVGRRLVDLPHTIAVEGHTDDVPVARRYPSNWELAAARASSVVRLLIEQGIAPDRLKVVSRAEFDPIASNETEAGRAKNRRIEIQLDVPIDDSDQTSGGEAAPTGGGSETVESDTGPRAAVDAKGAPAP